MQVNKENVSVRNEFDPEKIIFADFKIIKGLLSTPENFDITKLKGHRVQNSLEIKFNLNEKLAKADLRVDIRTESTGNEEEEATGSYLLSFIYVIENMEKLALPGKNNLLQINPLLTNSIASVTYSTARGILISKLQGTVFENFVLPVLNPNKLLFPDKEES